LVGVLFMTFNSLVGTNLPNLAEIF
jgi:hypothetical protein